MRFGEPESRSMPITLKLSLTGRMHTATLSIPQRVRLLTGHQNGYRYGDIGERWSMAGVVRVVHYVRLSLIASATGDSGHRRTGVATYKACASWL